MASLSRGIAALERRRFTHLMPEPRTPAHPLDWFRKVNQVQDSDNNLVARQFKVDRYSVKQK